MIFHFLYFLQSYIDYITDCIFPSFEAIRNWEVVSILQLVLTKRAAARWVASCTFTAVQLCSVQTWNETSVPVPRRNISSSITDISEYLCLKIEFCDFLCVGHDTHFNSITMHFFHGSYHYNSFCISGALHEFSVFVVHTFEINFFLSFLRSAERCKCK